jgi:hypothetical protein
MRKALTVATAVLGLLGPLFAVAQTNCTTIRDREGQAAYERCLRTERETEIQRRLQEERSTMTLQRQRINAHYEQLRDETDFQWSAVDLSMQRRIYDEQYRLQDLQRINRDDREAIERQQAKVRDLELERRLLSSAKDAYKRTLTDRERFELSQLDLRSIDRELQLRGWRTFADAVLRRW